MKGYRQAGVARGQWRSETGLVPRSSIHIDVSDRASRDNSEQRSTLGFINFNFLLGQPVDNSNERKNLCAPAGKQAWQVQIGPKQ